MERRPHDRALLAPLGRPSDLEDLSNVFMKTKLPLASPLPSNRDSPGKNEFRLSSPPKDASEAGAER